MTEKFFLLVFAVATLLYFGWLLYVIQKFKNRSMREKAIRRSNLYQAVWQLAKLSTVTYLILFLLQFIGSTANLSDREIALMGSYFPLFCFVGLIIFAFLSLFLQFIVLRLMGLPVVEE